MYNSFEFFFWRKCSTVVAVGVQTSFLPFAKSMTKKTTKHGFLPAGDCPAELLVIYLQAKPARFCLFIKKTCSLAMNN